LFTSAAAGISAGCLTYPAGASLPLARFDGHTRPVQAVAISPDGRLGLSVSDDRTIRLWDLNHRGSRIED
jgi:WD40 repeat protein